MRRRTTGRLPASLAVPLCVVVLVAGACTSSSPQGSGDGAAPGEISVKKFGARGDGVTDDSLAIQAAVDSIGRAGGTVRIPAGTYRIGSQVVIRHDHTSVTGDGPQSVLRLLDGIASNMFVMPVPFGTSTAEAVVRDVHISRLTLDGNGNGGPQTTPTFLGIQILHAEQVDLSQLVMRDWPFDAISVGVGDKPNVGITIRDSHFIGMGRNAIHLGFGSNLRISGVFVEDTPSQQWGPAAGNAVDVEVEGLNSFVDGFVIENSLFARAGTRTAGYGVALQPAFGPIRNGVIRGNVIRNHQHGVFVGTAEGITVEHNWVIADDNLATGAGISVFSGTATVDDNVVNMLRWPVDYGWAGVLIHQPTSPVSVRDNRVWGGVCTVRVDGSANGASVAGNQWGNQSGCFVDAGNPAGRVDQTDNQRRQVTSLDQEPPTIGLGLREGATVKPSTTVHALPADTGEGVARVLFLVDGVPHGFADRAPYDLRLADAHLAPGEHTVAAVAVDNAANVSTSASVKVRVAG